MRLFRLAICALVALLGIAGCGGGSPGSTSGTAAVLPQRVAQSTAGDEPSGSAPAAIHAGCDIRAVFVRFDTEIRGYPLDSSGVVLPCTQISGPQTQLFERGALAVSVHGNLHSLSFQADYGLTVHSRYADGDAPPSRLVRVSQDHVALAVDSLINDYVVASEFYAGDNCWFVIADKQLAANAQNCDANVRAIYALTTNDRDELIAIGLDAGGLTRIDVFADPASGTPRLVRTIGGVHSGLPALSGTQDYFNVSYSLSTDPRTGDLYVYSLLSNGLGLALRGAAPPQVAEFSATASGDVAPLRILSGPDVQLAQNAFAVNVIGNDDGGNLYVLSSGTTPVISVFGPGAVGDAPADRTFTDPTATIGAAGAAVAVRATVR